MGLLGMGSWGGMWGYGVSGYGMGCGVAVGLWGYGIGCRMWVMGWGYGVGCGVGSHSGTSWDPKMGPWGVKLWWDPSVGPRHVTL